MAVHCFSGCLPLVLLLVVGGRAAVPLPAEREKVLSDIFDGYTARNLSYECFRYSDHNQVAECDCLACVSAQPDFVSGMCAFRAFQETYYNEGEKPAFDPTNIWHRICDPKCGSALPTTCCDPSKDVEIENGCVKCLPTTKTMTVGVHASCLLAELDASSSRRRSGIGWKRTYAHYVDAMRQAKLSMKCASYALARTANPCDCEPCLKSETSVRTLREKLCEMGRVVRSKSELNRRDFWGHNDYFLNFCNVEKCPDMPQKCCEAKDDSASSRLSYPVDSNGCPACLPTSSLYGFGPACERRFARLSPAIRDRILKHF